MLELYVGYVSGVTDDYHAGRIKAITIKDKGIKYENIPYAFPFNPKVLHIIPKDGEAVIVLVSNDERENAQRYYIGPIISQPDKMEFDNYFSLSATRFLGGKIKEPAESVDNDAYSKGALPKEDEIAIVGRKNTDIILGENELRIRAGVRITDPTTQTVLFNRDNPAFIKLKDHNPVLDSEDKVIGQTKSTATIVADKINIISPNGDISTDVNDTKEGISDEQMEKIIAKAHRLPYGDFLCEFLSDFLTMYRAHSHPSAGAFPLDADPESAAFWAKYSVDKDKLEEKLLSKYVRIN